MKVEYPAPNTVSIWVGTFSGETAFDKCVDADVVQKLRLAVPIESICEVAFEKEPVTVRQLVNGCSGWETFIQEAEGAAQQVGCLSANAILVCYYLKCTEAPKQWGNLWFLGSFAGRDVS